MIDERHDLWQRISTYNPDVPGAALPFSRKLALQHGWTVQFTQKAIEEYKKFIYLCCISPHGASPSPVVDEVWHLHLTYTIDYWKYFCGEVLGQEIHHHPSRGGSGEQDKHRNWYRETLENYKAAFGQGPPEDIWPPPDTPSATSPLPPFSPRSFFEPGSLHRLWLLLLPFLLIFYRYRQPLPYHLNGPHFLVFFAVLCLCALAALLLSLEVKKRRMERLLRPVLQQATSYELAYLTGDCSRSFMVMITELLRSGALEYAPEYNYYHLSREALSGSAHPLAPALRSFPGNTALLWEVEVLALHHCAPWQEQYKPLQRACNAWSNHLCLPVLVVVTGLARCVQGLEAQRPVLYLCFLMLAFAGLCSLLIRQYCFRDICGRLLRMKDDYVRHLEDPQSAAVVRHGFLALTGTALFLHLGHRFDPRSGNERWMGLGNCSSGCGSNCGSGCGGCGGD